MSFSAVVRTIDVDVDPQTAFTIFTAEIGEWYVGDSGVRFDRGRLIDGGGGEMGQVITWEPGSRLVMTYRHAWLPPEPLTEIEVRFTPFEGGTRVSLEHRGWDRLPPEAVRRFVSRHLWLGLMRAFAARCAQRAGTPPSTR